MYAAVDARAWFLALCLLIVSPMAAGMGFGTLRVQSALGQPLRAHIALLSVTPAERTSLSVHLADAQLYQQLAVTYDHRAGPINLRMTPNQAISDRVLFDLTSDQPMNMPLLKLLVVAQTDRGKLVRQYTVFLDPAGDQQSAQASTSIPGTRYGPVQAGESLWDVATAFKYPDVSIPQMLVAIYRHNPKAFADTMSRLRVGSELIIPARSDVRAINSTAARQLLAAARQQRLNRLVAAVSGEQRLVRANVHAGTARGGGRLRLVTPRGFVRDAGRPPLTTKPVDAMSSAGYLTPTDAAAFGTLAMPAALSGDTPGRGVSAHGAHGGGTAQSLFQTNETRAPAAAHTFGHLATAPVAFPQRSPHQPDKRQADTQKADHPQATGRPGAVLALSADRDNAPMPVQREPARPQPSLRLLLWIVAGVCLLFAGLLWLHSRRHRPRLTTRVVARQGRDAAAPEVA